MNIGWKSIFTKKINFKFEHFEKNQEKKPVNFPRQKHVKNIQILGKSVISTCLHLKIFRQFEMIVPMKIWGNGQWRHHKSTFVIDWVAPDSAVRIQI